MPENGPEKSCRSNRALSARRFLRSMGAPAPVRGRRESLPTSAAPSAPSVRSA